jgi:hypothetical protein
MPYSGTINILNTFLDENGIECTKVSILPHKRGQVFNNELTCTIELSDYKWLLTQNIIPPFYSREMQGKLYICYREPDKDGPRFDIKTGKIIGMKSKKMLRLDRLLLNAGNQRNNATQFLNDDRSDLRRSNMMLFSTMKELGLNKGPARGRYKGRQTID